MAHERQPLFRLIFCLFGIVLAADVLSAQVTSTYNSSPFGNWTDGFRWSTSPVYPDNGQPGAGDTYNAIVPGGFVTLNQNITIQNYTQSGTGTINNSTGIVRTLTVNQLTDWQGGEIEGAVTINATGGININGASLKRVDAFNSANVPVINSPGSGSWTGGGVNATIVSDAFGVYFPTFNNLAGATFNAQANSFFNLQFNNSGTFIRSVGTGVEVHRAPFNNNGTALIHTGTLELARAGVSGGTFVVASGARLFLFGHTLQSTAHLTGPGVVQFSNPSGGGAGGADTIIAGTYNVGSTIIDQRLAFNTAGSTGSLLINKATGEPIVGTGTLTSTGPSVYQIGNFGGSVTIRAEGGMDFALISNVRWEGNARLQLAGGTSVWSGAFNLLEFRENTRFEVLSGATFEVNHAVGARRIFTQTTPGAFSNAGTLRKLGNGSLQIEVPATNTGFVSLQGGSLAFTQGLVQSGATAETRLVSGSLFGNLDIQGGLLAGVGTITGTVTSQGKVSPGLTGSPVGSMSITGGASLLSGGTCSFDMSGSLAGQFDRILIPTSTASIDGNISLAQLGGYVPTYLQAHELISAAGGVTGQFETVSGIEIASDKYWAITYDADSVFATAAVPGDADLNGVIDFDDYGLIDFGFLQGLNGWSNGDFDGNGVIDFDDYALIDFFFLQPPGDFVNLIPEPAAAATLLALVGALGLGRQIGRERPSPSTSPAATRIRPKPVR
jgi:hypothetical protein